MHEFSLLLVGSQGRQGNAVYLRTESNGNRLVLQIWEYKSGHLSICDWSDCWIVPYIRLVPAAPWQQPTGITQLNIILNSAFTQVRDGLFAYNLDTVVGGLAAFYMWQVSLGAEPLSNRYELCKVYSDQPYAIYIQIPHPCLPPPKLA